MNIKEEVMKSEEESFFDDKIKDLTSLKNSFLQMPTMICFNFCLKEMLDLCNVNSETGNKKYFELAKDFLNFLKKDIVLKELDMVVYINIIKKLKEFIENRDKINCTELYNFFIHIKAIFEKKYREKLKELIFRNLNKCTDYNTFEFLIETFINELLAIGYTYKFLDEVTEAYIKDKNFKNTNEFINFLLYTRINYDIYIPLKNFTKKDGNFIKNSFKEQDIKLGKDIIVENKELLPDTYYSHIYFKHNDYYKGINKQIKRLKSVLNFGKFYIGSKIDFDNEKKCIIKANEILDIKDKTLENILNYDFYRGNFKIINSATSTFKNLTGYDQNEKTENVIAKDFFNIIDYSEKDNNTLSIEQFINKWIALETLYSKSSMKNGFDSVLTYMPQILAITLFRKQFRITMKRAQINKSLEKFIMDCYQGNADEVINSIKSKFYRKCMEEYKEIIINPKKFAIELYKIMERIKMNIYRIYIFRNRYVHTGETKSYYDIPQYMLCQILALSIDKFIKAINDLNRMETKNITWDIVFNSLLNKYITIYNGIKILSEDYKVDNTYTLKREEILKDKDSIENILQKIMLEMHMNLFEVKSISKKETRKQKRILNYTKTDKRKIFK